MSAKLFASVHGMSRAGLRRPARGRERPSLPQPRANHGAVADGHPLRIMARASDEDRADDDRLGIVGRGIAPVPFTHGE